MTTEQLARHFHRMGARVFFRPLSPRNTRREPGPGGMRLDVASDSKGEYFDFALGPEAPSLSLLQASPGERHLLLMDAEGRRYLCGHDERHWFIAAVRKPVSSVRDAKRALMPEEVLEMAKGLPPGETDNCRNGVFLRQGEWFFVPADRDFPDHWILRNEPLQRTARSKPHVCSELVRRGGELVYVMYHGTYTKEELDKRLKDYPYRRKAPFTTHIRNPRVYARGTVRHADHATIRLSRWHRVFLNGEIAASETVGFLD